MNISHKLALLALLILGTWGCDRCKNTALEHLAAQKIGEVELFQLTQQGCAYRFTGSRDGRFCDGQLNIRFSGSLAQVNLRDRCNPESKETVTGPHVAPPPDRTEGPDKGARQRPLTF